MSRWDPANQITFEVALVQVSVMGHGNHLSYHTHLTSKALKLGSILDILYHPLHNLFWSKCASSHWWYTSLKIWHSSVYIQLCLIICGPMDCSLPVSFAHGIFQARILESESESHSVMSNSLWPYRLYSPWNSPGQHTGVGSLSLLQGIFPIQGSNPGLPHCRWILYQLSHKGSPKIQE